MEDLLICIPALILGFLLLTFMLIVYWYIEIAIHQPATNMDSYRHMYAEQAIGQLGTDLAAFAIAIPTLLLGALASVVSGVLKNGWVIFFFFLLAIPAIASNQYHNTVIHSVIIIRQCILVPFAYNLLFPLLNSLRLFYNAAIILYDYYVDISKIGPWMILLKCTLSTIDLTSFFGYFSNIFFAWTDDLIAWFSSGFLDNDLDIMATLDAIGLFLDCMVLPLTCLCKALGFLWEALSIFVRLPSLHSTLNCILNFIISILQIPINTVMSANPLQPNFERPVYKGCCALKSAASAIEDTVYLIAETGWGVFSNTDLPIEIQIFLSAQWAHVLSDPLCGALILVNMTLTMATHYNDLTDSEGIAYFQFGTVFDELKSAANHLASIFALWNNDAQAFIAQTLLTIINLLAFVFEWIPGNIYYWLFGGPLPLYPSAPFVSGANFVKFYFPDYWLKPSFDTSINNSTYVYQTALNSAFTSLFMTTQAFGNLIANLIGMDPLGGMIQHLLNMIISLIQILANLISFIYAITTFDTNPLTTAKQVNFDNFFNEMYFFAGSVGDFWRQFAEPDPLTNFTCQISANEDENSVWCCAGDMFEQLIDTIAVLLQQIVHFLQDLLTLPTGNVMFCFIFIPFNATSVDQCVRIPDLSVALFLLDETICSFTCAVFSIIPLISEFQCNFPPPPPPTDPQIPPQNVKPCGHVSTCTANLACSVIRILLVPLIYANTFFVQTISGVSFNSYTDLASVGAQILFNVLAQILEAFGLLINCTLCAFTGSGTNCADDIYQIFAALAELVRFLPLILTRTFFIITKLVLTFIKGLFTGDPIGAVIQLAVGMLQDLFGGLGAAVVNFLVKFFDGIGLGVIGQFIKVLWLGFCPILQALLNTFILALKAITFGAVQINWVEFCCSGDPACTPSNRKRGPQENLIDGVLHLQLETWVADIVQHFNWAKEDPCNTSMDAYAKEQWSNLTEWQQNEVLLCLVKPFWNMRDDNQTYIGNSTCDILMMEYNRTTWTEIEILSRRTMIDCMWSRMIIEGIRKSSGVKWIPSDLLSAPYRKYVFGTELARGFLIYWQFTKDQSVTAETFTSASYRESWANYGLNVSHYLRVSSTDDILIFRNHYRLYDYFVWNGDAPQYEAVQALTSGGSTFFFDFIKTLSNTTKAFSDEQLDPTIYLQYTYSMDDSVAGITSSLYFLGNDLMNGSQQVYNFWANPVNIKRRSEGFQLVKEGTWEMYQASRRQMTMMGIEYWQEKREGAKKWAGECSSMGECQAFVDEYNRSMHEDKHSLVYRLNHWYEKNKQDLFKVYPIRHEFTGGESHDKLFQWYHPEKRVPGESYKIFPTISGNINKNQHWMQLSGQQMQHSESHDSGNPMVHWKTEKKFSNGAPPVLFSRGRPRPLERQRIYDQPLSMFNYTDRQGRVVHESGRERFWRYYELIFKGTERSRTRWERAGVAWTTMKERVYRNVVRNNIQFAVDHVERAYRNQEHLSTRERERMEREKEREAVRAEGVRVEQRKKVEREIEARHTRVIHKNEDLSSLAVYQRLREEQSEYCHRKDFEADGLCQMKIKAPTASSLMTREQARKSIIDEYDQFTNPVVRRYNGKGPDPFLYLPPLPPVGTHPPGIMFSSKSGMRMMMKSEMVRQATVTANSYLDLTCYTNITFGNSTLCDECFMLDQIVGRIESGLEWMYEYFAGGQLAASFKIGMDFYAYSFNENLTAIYGDSAQLRFGEWPGFDTNDFWFNTRPWGDPTPNKTRISDFLGMINNATNGTNSTAPNTGGSAINNIVAQVVYAVFPMIWDFIQKVIEYFSGGTSNTIIMENAMYFIETFYLCDWIEGRDIRSLDIRFSFGEGVLLFITIYATVSIILLSTISWSAFNLIALSSMGLMIVGSTFMTIVFNFSWQCFPAFPAAFADSLFYFLAYTVLPKCEWFFAFLIRNPEYDNDTCQNCESAEGWDVIQCVDDLGFIDIFANIIFMVQFYAPEWLEFIRDSTLYPVAMFYHIPIVNERLNAFTDVDMSDRRTYAHYMGCNYIMTLWANLIIITSVLFVLYLFSPLATAVLTLGWLLFLLLWSMWRLDSLICEDVFITQTVAPHTMSGFMDGPITEDQSLSEFTIPGRDGSQDGVSQDGPMRFNATRFQSRLGRRMVSVRYPEGGEQSGFSLMRMKNMIMRGWDNFTLSDRKTR